MMEVATKAKTGNLGASPIEKKARNSEIPLYGNASGIS